MNKSSAPFKRAYTSSSKDLPRGKRRKVEYYADSSMRQKVVERLVEILQINVTVSVSVKDIRNVAEDIESCLFDYSDGMDTYHKMLSMVYKKTNSTWIANCLFAKSIESADVVHLNMMGLFKKRAKANQAHSQNQQSPGESEYSPFPNTPSQKMIFWSQAQGDAGEVVHPTEANAEEMKAISPVPFPPKNTPQAVFASLNKSPQAASADGINESVQPSEFSRSAKASEVPQKIQSTGSTKFPTVIDPTTTGSRTIDTIPPPRVVQQLEDVRPHRGSRNPNSTTRDISRDTVSLKYRDHERVRDGSHSSSRDIDKFHDERRETTQTRRSGHCKGGRSDISELKWATETGYDAYGRKVFVGNLDSKTKKSDLRSMFSRYGSVTNVFIPRVGFGFVTFKDKMSAQRAVNSLKNSFVDGRLLKCDIARPRKRNRYRRVRERHLDQKQGYQRQKGFSKRSWNRNKSSIDSREHSRSFRDPRSKAPSSSRLQTMLKSGHSSASARSNTSMDPNGLNGNLGANSPKKKLTSCKSEKSDNHHTLYKSSRPCSSAVTTPITVISSPSRGTRWRGIIESSACPEMEVEATVVYGNPLNVKFLPEKLRICGWGNWGECRPYIQASMASKNRTRNVLIVSMPKSENLTSRFLRGHAAVIEQKIKNGDKLKAFIFGQTSSVFQPSEFDIRKIINVPQDAASLMFLFAVFTKNKCKIDVPSSPFL
mmetsp:Transcript_23261/g.36536  ORF Transcript_23261/g.36536 Transcript_23261/m.36536 type:complete len:711 (-) Transcript_23261:77-2209(-)